MKYQRLAEGIYVFPDSGMVRKENAIAGPFADRDCVGQWMVERLESHLPKERLPMWSAALESAGGIHADTWQCVTLLGMVLKGKSWAQIAPYTQPLRPIAPVFRVDRRQLASGERAEPIGAQGETQ